MTALQKPAPDAPAEEWGRFAVRIPDWRWPDGMHDAAPGFWANEYGAGSTGDVIRFALNRVGLTVYPNPDHWAWEGWLWRLAGRPEVMVERRGQRVRIWDGSPHAIQQQLSGTGPTIGRALIAYAAANGRWPGGEREAVLVAHSMTARPGEDAVPTAALGKWPGGAA